MTQKTSTQLLEIILNLVWPDKDRCKEFLKKNKSHWEDTPEDYREWLQGYYDKLVEQSLAGW